MLKSRTTVIAAAAAFAVGLSWGAYAGGRAAGWWEASDEHAENLFVRDRDGLRICVAANDGAKPSTTETEEALRGLRGDASFAAMYPESGQTLADACPGGPRTFRRDRDGEYADVSVVSTHADFSLFVFVGNVDGARRGFEFVPLELQCGGDTCEAVTWALFVPRAVVESPSDYEEALRWVFQLPGKWTAGAVDGQSANGRSEPQPTVEGVPAYPPALDPLASARICVQAAEGVPAEAVDRVIKGLSQALSSEPRYGGVSVQAGCRGGYVEPGIWASSDGLLAQIFLPTKQKSDDLGLNKLSSLGYLREPLNPDRCAEKCATAPARLYLKYESFDAPEDLDGDRAGLVTDLRNALFGLR